MERDGDIITFDAIDELELADLGHELDSYTMTAYSAVVFAAKLRRSGATGVEEATRLHEVAIRGNGAAQRYHNAQRSATRLNNFAGKIEAQCQDEAFAFLAAGGIEAHVEAR